MRTILVIAATLLVSACNKDPEHNGSAGRIDQGGNYAARVGALPIGERNAVFFRALQDAGSDCQDVTKSERIADTAGAPTWRAVCDNGTMNLVQVKPDGTAIVVSPTIP